MSCVFIRSNVGYVCDDIAVLKDLLLKFDLTKIKSKTLPARSTDILNTSLAFGSHILRQQKH